MLNMKDEISEIPYRADVCYQKNKGIILPESVPYLGMGSSYISTTVFRYLGIDLYPEVADEYYNYLLKYKDPKKGVLISQSGESSETLWCADHINSFIAILNNPKSALGMHKNCSKKICLYSGDDDTIPSKTYINTLLVLYLGFGFDPGKVIPVIKNEFQFFRERGEELGEVLYKRIRWRRKKGIYVIGSGPNVATANYASLILSQVAKVPVNSMPIAQFDHGYKETAKNSLVVAINHKGPNFERTRKMLQTVKNAGGKIFELTKPKVDSIYSPLTFALPFIFAAHYLAEKFKVGAFFNIGDKIISADKD